MEETLNGTTTTSESEEVETIANDQYIVAQYKFDSSIDTLPTFNMDFVYTYTDVDNGDGTITRTIMSDSILNSISFMDCTGLLEVYDLNLGNLTNLDYLFYGCNELTYIDLSKIKSNTEITSLNYTFCDCKKLAGKLDLSKLNVKIVSGLDNTFDYCVCLTSINLHGWDISEAYGLNRTFANCTNLRTLNIDEWNFTNIITFLDIFLNTDALSTISIQNSIVDSINNFIYFALPQRTNTGNVLNIYGIDDLDLLTGSGVVSYAESYNWNIVYDVIDEPDNNELIQGGINDESGAFENEIPNIVKTKYIDISDKKQILVNVLTEDVYIAKCYLYNANKELVKIIDISTDKKRMFGLDLQKLIDEVMNDGNE